MDALRFISPASCRPGRPSLFTTVNKYRDSVIFGQLGDLFLGIQMEHQLLFLYTLKCVSGVPSGKNVFYQHFPAPFLNSLSAASTLF